MTYTSDKPKLAESTEELRARIPGWGADLDPKDRPSVPQERFDPGATGAHWEFPDRQPELVPRERSIEHQSLTPVFGTTCPTRGVSGVMRRYAYARYSEARAAHWLLLLASDRVDTLESTLRSFVSRSPDNPIAETGVRAELQGLGLASRFRGRRVDRRHHALDPVSVAAPWVAGAVLAVGVARRVTRARRR